MKQGPRAAMINDVAEAVQSLTLSHPTRVAIDGPPASGKTTLADELAVVLNAAGRDVVRATIDHFMFPRAQRYRRGAYSPEGCFFDSHDWNALKSVLLDPLGPGGNLLFRQATYDRATDTALLPRVMTASAEAVLLFDGVFLMRPEVNDRWDLRVFVSASFDETVNRALVREKRSSSPFDVERRWRDRYIPSQQLYYARIRPTDHADVVVDNDDPHRPAWEIRVG